MREQYREAMQKICNLAKKQTTAPRILRQEFKGLARDMLKTTGQLPWTHPEYKIFCQKVVKQVGIYESKQAASAERTGDVFEPFLERIVDKFNAKLNGNAYKL